MKKYLFFFLILFGFTPPADAVLPPLSSVEAFRRSNVVVEALVTNVRPASKTQMMFKTDCGEGENRIATLQVFKYFKGKGTVVSPLVLHHRTYHALDSQCSGGQELSGYSKGDKEKFYLSCSDKTNCYRTYEGSINESAR